MRSWDIAVLLITFNIAIGLVGNIGLFQHTYYNQNQQSVNSTNGFTSGSITDTETLVGSLQTKNADYFNLGLGFYAACGIIWSVLINTVYMVPALVNTFHFSMELAVPIQVLVYCVNAFGIVQFLSGRSGGMIQ